MKIVVTVLIYEISKDILFFFFLLLCNIVYTIVDYDYFNYIITVS